MGKKYWWLITIPEELNIFRLQNLRFKNQKKT